MRKCVPSAPIRDGNGAGMRNRESICKNDMAADTKAWVFAGNGDGIVKGAARGHQGCGSEDACLVKLANGTVYAWG